MLRNYPVISRMVVILIDNIIILFSFYIAITLRNASLDFLRAIPSIVKTLGFGAYHVIATEIGWGQHWVMLILIIFVWRALMGYQEANEGSIYTRSFTSLRNDIMIIFRTVLLGCMIVFSIAFTVKSTMPPSLIIIFGIVNFTMLSIERTILFNFLNYLYKRGKDLKEVLVVGTGDAAKQFIDSVKMFPDWGIKIKALVSKNKSDVGRNVLGHKVIDYCGNLKATLHSHPVDELVVALSLKDLEEVDNILNICDEEGITVNLVSPFFKTFSLKVKTEFTHGLPIIRFLQVERQELDLALKRFIDIAGSLIALIILFPLFVIIMVLIKAGSQGPIFYKWKIIGLNKKPIISYKFRTMVQEADEIKITLAEKNEMSGPVFKMKDDPRITKTGKWLRKYSLDELPQLWSVLKGDLSLVGPRPPLQSEVERYEGWHRRKLSVKPGITCLWQISGRNEINDFNEWMRLDLKYIDEWNIWLDIKILFKTIFVVLKGTGR